MTGPVHARFEPRMPATLHREDDDAEQDRDERAPYVAAKTEFDDARVDPDRLEPHPADAVEDEVQADELAPAEVIVPLEQQQHGHAEKVPDHLVEERRVKQGARRQADRVRGVRRLDLQPPRQVGRLAVQLVVEVVAEPADRLGEQECRRQRIREAPEPDAGDPAPDEYTECAAEQRSEDRDAALPDVERGQRVSGRVRSSRSSG